MQGLKNEDFRIRGLSAFNLGNMGEKAAGAILELEQLAKADPNAKVRQNAAEAANKIRAATGQPSD
jgi:HEAT repeat protein